MLCPLLEFRKFGKGVCSRGVILIFVCVYGKLYIVHFVWYDRSLDLASKEL